MSTPRRLVLVALSLGLIATACGGTERPDTASWLPQWDSIRGVIPPQDDLGDPPDEELCQATLAEIRTQNEELRPTPSSAVDDLTLEWVAVAESAFFDCPPEGEQIDSFAAAYDELDRIQTSIEEAIADGA